MGKVGRVIAGPMLGIGHRVALVAPRYDAVACASDDALAAMAPCSLIGDGAALAVCATFGTIGRSLFLMCVGNEPLAVQ